MIQNNAKALIFNVTYTIIIKLGKTCIAMGFNRIFRVFDTYISDEENYCCTVYSSANNQFIQSNHFAEHHTVAIELTIDLNNINCTSCNICCL